MIMSMVKKKMEVLEIPDYVTLPGDMILQLMSKTMYIFPSIVLFVLFMPAVKNQ